MKGCGSAIAILTAVSIETESVRRLHPDRERVVLSYDRQEYYEAVFMKEMWSKAK